MLYLLLKTQKAAKQYKYNYNTNEPHENNLYFLLTSWLASFSKMYSEIKLYCQ